MAKRNTKPTRTDNSAPIAADATPTEGMEQRVLDFAEQLGRMVGTIQVKAEGWMDRETLNKQLASVRDGATHLLQQLGAGVTAAKKKPAAATARKGTKGRSGGAVDAPGKKHRKQLPPDPGATKARSQAGKMRTAMPMAKTSKLRGRG
jgi:hypothetical protein